MENVNHPQHYNQSKFEAIDIIEDWKLNFNLGCVIKYIARAEFKGKQLEDLEKAQWYLNREIQRLSNQTTYQPKNEYKVNDWESFKRFFKENTPLCITFVVCLLIVLVAFIVK